MWLNVKNNATVLVWLLLACAPAFSQLQDCDKPAFSAVMQGNEIRSVLGTADHVEYTGDRVRMQVPFTHATAHNVMQTDGIWIGGYDEVGNFSMAAQRYDIGTDYDFAAGPILIWEEDWHPDLDCSDWDTIWSVHQFEIMRHIADWEDNGVIDVPIHAIFGWPGYGNAFFEQLTGIDFPEHPSYENLSAPFHDRNNNGIYEPGLGEYPHPENINPATIASQITWSVFNDYNTLHTQTQGDRVGVEVQLTSFSFSCDETPVLNSTLFKSYKIVNRSTSALDALYFGIWCESSVVCESHVSEGRHRDDHIGSWPDGNTFFFYSSSYQEDPDIQPCSWPINYPQNNWAYSAPSLAYTFLNHDLSSFMYYVNGAIGNPPSAMSDPQSGAPLQFYRLLTGSWRDGTPLTYGGLGYVSGGQGDSTRFVFPGNPSDTTSWAMSNIDTSIWDRKSVGAVFIDRLDIVQSTRIDVAISFHHDSTLTSLGNVDLMYQNVADLQNKYNDGLRASCTPWYTECANDCIYAGDANHDGVADGRDYLEVALFQDETGIERNTPISWAPATGTDWGAQTANGIELKHMDCNGNGGIDHDDLEIIDLHHGLVNEYYQPEPVQPPGKNLQITGETFSVDLSDFSNLDYQFEVLLSIPAEDSIYGLTFRLEYDNSIWADARVMYFTPSFGDFTRTSVEHNQGFIDFTCTNTRLFNSGLDEHVVAQVTLTRWDTLFLYPSERDTTFLRISNAFMTKYPDQRRILFGDEAPVVLKGSTTATLNTDHREVLIYPNPTRDIMYFDCEPCSHETTYNIFQSDGSRVANGKVTGSQISIDLPTGLYFLVLEGEAGTFREKFVVVRSP